MKKKNETGNARRTKIGDISAIGLSLTEAQLRKVAGGVTFPSSLNEPYHTDGARDYYEN